MVDDPILQLLSEDDTMSARLFPLRGAQRLEDGRIVVAGGPRLAWFSPDGAVLFERGGAGGGPDEFAAFISTIFLLPPDGIGVLQSQRSGPPKLALYDGAGRRTNVAFRDGTYPPLGFGRLADGRWVVWGPAVPGMEVTTDTKVSGFYASGRALLVVSAAGSAVDTVGYVPYTFRPRDKTSGLTLIGTSVFTVMDSSIVFGDAAGHSVSVMRPDGTITKRFRWAGGDLTVNESDQAKWRKSYIETAAVPPGQDPRILEERAAAMRFADRMAAYVELRTDPDRNIWIRHLTVLTDPQVYTVLASDGRLLGDITMPANFQVTQIGTDFILGIWTDKTDAEYVRMYELVKR